MNFFKCGDRVKLKSKVAFFVIFDFPGETGVVAGYATLGSGVPCLIVSMDVPDSNGVRHEHLVVSMDAVLPL